MLVNNFKHINYLSITNSLIWYIIIWFFRTHWNSNFTKPFSVVKIASITPFDNVTDPYILIRASLIVGLLSNSRYRSRHFKNFSNPVFILLLILGFLFISEKNAVASCKANSKTFVEKLKERVFLNLPIFEKLYEK